MQLAAHVTDPLDNRLFDIHVHVFQLRPKLERAFLDLASDLPQFLDDLVRLILLDKSLGSQHLHVGHRADDIVRGQPPVKADALRESLDAAVGRLLKDAAAAKCLGLDHR